MRLYLVAILTTLLLSVCHKEEQIASCNGIWESIGHGRILEIRDSIEYIISDITSISCVPFSKRNFNEIKASLSLERDTLVLIEGPLTFKFTRLDKLPEPCTNNIANELAGDPIYNFEVFMETVKEHYAFLELNKVDWDKLYSTQKRKFTSNSSEVDLYLILEETFEKLNDNHAYLEASDNLYDKLEKLQANEDSFEDNEIEYGDFPVAEMVAKNYLQENMTKDSWIIEWGKMTDEIGFIQLKAMWLFAEINMSETLIDSIGYLDAYVLTRSKMFEGEFIKKEIEGVDNIMNRVINDLADTKSIVIDVRFNGGGQDAVSAQILSHFNTNRRPVAKSKFRYGNRHTATHTFYVSSKRAKDWVGN